MATESKTHLVEKEDNLQYDLANLSAADPNPINVSSFSSDPEYLTELTRDNAQLLLNRIFGLPTEPLPSDLGIGRLAVLPPAVTAIPREKPLPKGKPKTKWEEFAATKGIKKRKKSAMEFDEATGEYKRRYGYQRANDPTKQNEWLIEAKAGDKMGEDPWAQLKKERKERVAANKAKQLKNLKRAEGPRLPGTIDLTTAIPVKPTKGKKNKLNGVEKGKPKHHVDVALKVAQVSTASMGKFDKKVYNEPTRPKLKAKQTNQKLGHLKTKSTGATVSLSSEKEKSLSVLSKVLQNYSIAPTTTTTADFGGNETTSSSKKGGKKNKSKSGKGGKDGTKKKSRYENPSVDIDKVASKIAEIGRAVQQECRDRSRMPSSA
eukprot:TRINITY_DN6905_c0_g1_i3.p1 TRINITY_DN6905_c0_g1~~TRINITY_DN6905_c0_g1_i3.p1  ORF type:complete len:376 (-),score=71.50 TRINITY_DN6905_c0_g1_i3:22-1149(-)